MTLCRVCHQPECPESTGETRPAPGVLPSRLEPGQREARGYGEWAIHPDEAQLLLHRGYAIVDGVPQHVTWQHNERWVTQVRVLGTNEHERPLDRFVDSAMIGKAA